MSAKAGNVAVAAIVQKQLVEGPDVLAEVALTNPKSWRSAVSQHVRSMVLSELDTDSDIMRACVKASGVTVVGVLDALDWTRLERAVVKAVAGAFPESLATRRASVPPPSRRGGAELTAKALYDEAAKLRPPARWHSHVFLGPLLERFGTTPQQAKSQLLALHRSGEIVLTRADLVDVLPPDLVRSSALDAGGYVFHFLSPRDE